MMRTKRIAFSFVVGLSSLIGGCAGGSAAEETPGEAVEALGVDACPAGIPAALNPGPNQTLKSKFTGVGVQIYMCNATKAGGYAWTFVAPSANLLNDDGKLVGTHFIGPTWQGNDESSVAGARVAGATVDPSALPWLLLSTPSHGVQEGRFSDVTTIQRLSTIGGNAPPSGCDATTLGTILQVPYSADYFFYKTKTDGKVQQCAAAAAP